MVNCSTLLVYYMPNIFQKRNLKKEASYGSQVMYKAHDGAHPNTPALWRPKVDDETSPVPTREGKPQNPQLSQVVNQIDTWNVSLSCFRIN